jgi:DNA mismatch endonuclease (patch repair protein)
MPSELAIWLAQWDTRASCCPSATPPYAAVLSEHPALGSSNPAPPASSPSARNRMRANRSESSVERTLRSELHRRGLRSRRHAAAVAGLRCRPDIVFSRARVAVLVDGCFWHRCPEHASTPHANGDWWDRKLTANARRDLANTAALQAAGWIVMSLWEHDSVEQKANAILAVVGHRDPQPNRPLPIEPTIVD